MREERTEVLVVGAGPVGLWTALSLAESGVEVILIDREQRTAARSYACALHPATLKLLEQFGLIDSVLERGKRISTVAFYDRSGRKAELNFAELNRDYPFLLILPQGVFEGILEERLRRAGVPVRWNQRFDSMERNLEEVEATIEELSGTSMGYVVPHWETIVKERWLARSQFLVGADGFRSIVRQRMGVEFQKVQGPSYFAAYEFDSNQPDATEVRVVLDDETASVLWPLPGNRFRWTFQMVRSDTVKEFPEKERRAVQITGQNVDDEIRRYVEKTAKGRAPWFTASIGQIAWCSGVVFEQRLASEFGRGRCWLLGDAAHQTGPVGVQSINAGFVEAQEFTVAVKQVLREGAPLTVLEAFNQAQQARWRSLLGQAGGLRPRTDASPWVRDHASRLLPCLPATGLDLARLASQ